MKKGYYEKRTIILAILFSAIASFITGASIRNFIPIAVVGNQTISRNEFVTKWNRYINEGDPGAFTAEQRKDVDIIFALVTFGNGLRENFIAAMQGKKQVNGRDRLNVRAPLTNREMRRCGYWLSKMMTSAEKSSKTAENIARDLLNDFFLGHIDNEKDAEAIRTAWGAWTVERRDPTLVP